MVSVWQFHITSRLAKGEKLIQAHTARKDEQLQKNADTKHCIQVPYDSQLSLQAPSVPTSEKRARQMCKWTRERLKVCAECARGGALFEHNQR